MSDNEEESKKQEETSMEDADEVVKDEDQALEPSPSPPSSAAVEPSATASTSTRSSTNNANANSNGQGGKQRSGAPPAVTPGAVAMEPGAAASTGGAAVAAKVRAHNRNNDNNNNGTTAEAVEPSAAAQTTRAAAEHAKASSSTAASSASAAATPGNMRGAESAAESGALPVTSGQKTKNVAATTTGQQHRDITEKIHAHNRASTTSPLSNNNHVEAQETAVNAEKSAQVKSSNNDTDKESSDLNNNKSEDLNKKDVDLEKGGEETAFPPSSTEVNHGRIHTPAVHEQTAFKKEDEPMAIATPVDETEEKIDVAQLVQEDDEPFYKKSIFLILLVVFLVVAGIVIGVTVWAVNNNKEDDNKPPPTAPSTMAPTTAAPTASPTQEDKLLEKLSLIDIIGPDVVKTSREAFDSAADWFYTDELKFLEPQEATGRRDYRQLQDNGDMPFNLQRFTLAWFYFHTTKNGEDPWLSCNPPGPNDSEECDLLEITVIRIIAGDPVLCFGELPGSLRWLTSTPECEWPGVRCYPEGDVGVLELYAMGLKGEFPAFLNIIPRLQVVRLSYGALSGTLPDTMNPVDMPFLFELSLIGNILEGPLPENIFDTNLQNLNLALNQFKGTLPSAIASMNGLSALYLFSNQFEGQLPEELGQSQGLQYVQLHDNNFGGSLPESWYNLTRLLQLHLHDNAIGGTIPAMWSELTSMMELRAYNNRLFGEVPRMDWPGLLGIFLDGNNLNGTFPEEWYNKRDLRFIDLQQNSFYGQLQDRFNQTGNETGLNQLSVLSLNDNDFTGPIPASLEGLDAIRILALNGNDFTGPVPEELCNLRSQTGLQLLNADCDGDPPANECSCCTTCCDREARTCQTVESRRRLEKEDMHHAFVIRDRLDEFHPGIFPLGRALQQDECVVRYRWVAETGELDLYDP